MCLKCTPVTPHSESTGAQPTVELLGGCFVFAVSVDIHQDHLGVSHSLVIQKFKDSRHRLVADTLSRFSSCSC